MALPIGIVGTGLIGRIHATAARQTPAVDLLALRDVDPEAAASAAVIERRRRYGRGRRHDRRRRLVIRAWSVAVAEIAGRATPAAGSLSPPEPPGSTRTRSIQEVLDHADKLAQRLEDYEPTPGDEVDVAEYQPRRAAIARACSERQVLDAVLAACRAGVSWTRIGRELGVSAQAAQQRYGEAQTAT